MTNEELEKTMNFILESEARSSAKLEELIETQKRNEERWKRTDERLTRTDERLARTDERWTRTEEGIRALLTIAEIHEREITSLAETTRATDDRLNALIAVVERHISEGRNGKS